jgi:NAD-dependent deacetylase sirtuin 4
LEVWSSFRFVKAASEKKIPIIILNIGPTRGDPFATMKIEAPVGDLLPKVAQELGLDQFVIRKEYH